LCQRGLTTLGVLILLTSPIKTMANQLDIMDLKQIINLHLDGTSNRKISRTLGLHRNTVNEYIRSFKSSDLSMEELRALNQADLEELVSSKTTINNERFAALMSFLRRCRHIVITLDLRYSIITCFMQNSMKLLTDTHSLPHITSVNTNSPKAL